MKIINFFQYKIKLLVIFIALFSEINAHSGSLVDLKGFGSRIYKVTTETLDVSANTFYSKFNKELDDCINWYSVVYSSDRFGQLVVPSMPKGIFIFFSSKKSKCNIDEQIKNHFLSIPKISLGFDVSSVNHSTKLYSKDEITYELSKVNKSAYLDFLSKSNIFTPNHPEFFSLEDEDLAFIHFSHLNVENKILTELLASIFELSSFNTQTVSILRFSFKDHSRNYWKTRITSKTMNENKSEKNCKYENLEVVRKLSGSGFHWTVETETKNFQSTPILLDSFNREVFLDIDEISQRNERGDSVLVPLHPVHIERPSEESESSLLLGIGKSTILPIHARYQSACNGCNFKTLVLGLPSIINYEEQSDNKCMVPNLRFEITPSKNVKIGSSQKEIIINIPVGNSKDINYVFIATIFTIIITTVTTGVSIRKFS